MALSTLPVITDESGQKVAAVAIVSVDENGDLIGGTGGSSATSAKQDEIILLLTDIKGLLNTTQTDLPPTPLVTTTRFDGRTVVAISTATTSDLIPATSAKKGRSYRGSLTIDGATLITIKRGSTTLGQWRYGSGGGQLNWRDEDPPFETGTNEALTITSTAAVHVDGIVDYELS